MSNVTENVEEKVNSTVQQLINQILYVCLLGSEGISKWSH